MIRFVKNIQDFWSEDLKRHSYARQVPFVAKNFDHLDRTYYNRDYLLQSFNDELPGCWKNFYSAVGVDKGSVSWTCIIPNLILPSHRDTFFTLRQQLQIEVEQCIRYLIFLEDWQFGHLLGFEHMNIVNWKKGDVWAFDSTELHFAVNASNSHFHSCQVSTTI